MHLYIYPMFHYAHHPLTRLSTLLRKARIDCATRWSNESKESLIGSEMTANDYLGQRGDHTSHTRHSSEASSKESDTGFDPRGYNPDKHGPASRSKTRGRYT